MYSVYLADDEPLIREGLAQTIPWESMDLQLLGMAADGKCALRGIQELRPDIVLTDIRMSHMDGLELIGKIRELRSDCRIVIITGYGDFSYAQSAIHLGVSDFILKPIDIPALCRTLNRIKQELDSERDRDYEVETLRVRLQEADNYQLQRMLRRYMTGRTPVQAFLEGLPETLRSAKAVALVMLQIDHFDRLTAAMDEETIFDLTRKLELCLNKTGNSTRPLVIEHASGQYLLLFAGDYAEAMQHEIRSYIRRLRLVEFELDFTTATSPVYSDIASCKDAYNFVRKGCDYAFQLGKNQDVQPDEILNGTLAQMPDVPNVGRVIRSISTFKKSAIRKDFDLLAEDIRQTGHNSYLYTRMLVSVVYGEIVKLLVDIDFPIDSILENPLEEYRKILTCATLDEMIQGLYVFVAQICDFLEDNVNANQSVAERAKAYIEAHYADSSLTLDRVAEAMGISPNYFSALFKQGTGDSFVNYLTNTRIAHAKELLNSGHYKTYEVAMRCGYENPTYFSTIFKRRTGVSPSMYHEN